MSTHPPCQSITSLTGSGSGRHIWDLQFLKEVLSKLRMYVNGYSMAIVLDHMSTSCHFIDRKFMTWIRRMFWRSTIIDNEPRKSYILLCKLQLNVNRMCILLLFYIRIINKGQFDYKYDLFWVQYISAWCALDEEAWFNDSHHGLSPFIRGSRPWSNGYLPMTFIFKSSEDLSIRWHFNWWHMPVSLRLTGDYLRQRLTLGGTPNSWTYCLICFC